MAKKKSPKAAQRKPETKAQLMFKDIEYNIQSLTFEYSFTQNPVFQAVINIRVPDEYINYPISICMPIPALLSLVAMNYEGMSNYVQKVIDGFDDPVTRESLAIKSLEEEGFDLHHLVRCALEQASIDPLETPEARETAVKIFALGDVGFTIQHIDLGYTHTEPRVCFVKVLIKVPDHVFNQAFTIGFELDKGLESVEKYDAGMAKYFKKTLIENQNELDSEIVTFQSLASEGFDLKQFMIHALMDYELKIEKKVTEK